MTDNKTEQTHLTSRRLAMLVYLLQLLTVLFGITTIMGVLFNHAQWKAVQGTIAESHFRWQIITFWLTAAVFTSGLVLKGNPGQYLMISAVVWLYYRAAKGLVALKNNQPAPRY